MTDIDTPDVSDALAIIRIALGSPDVTADDIPPDAVFGLRRDVEYVATPGHINREVYHGSGDLAAPRNYTAADSRDRTDTREPLEWVRTSETDDDPGDPETGEWEPLESQWVGSEVMVYPFRWDVTVTGLAQLARGLSDLDAYPNGWEQLGGYLDTDPVDGIPRIFPAASYTGDGADWNIGGVTPVFVYADYLIIY